MSEKCTTELNSSLLNLFDEVGQTTTHCLAYRSSEQIPGRELIVSGGWRGQEALLNGRDSIMYRATALEWHVQLLGETAQKEVERMAATGQDVLSMSPNLPDRTLARLGWIFDDLIFNSISLLDYCAKFVCSSGFTLKKPPQYDWSGINKPKNRDKLDHTLLKIVLNDENKGWFIPLQKYRSHVIHNKIEVGSMSMTSGTRDKVPTLFFKCYVSDKAVAGLPLFNRGDKVDLIDGSAKIALRTIQSVRRVLQTMISLDYVCVHDPFTEDRWRDPMPNPIDKLIGER